MASKADTATAWPVWDVAPAPVHYATAVNAMTASVDAISAGLAPERIWLVEHPPVITAGTSADTGDLLQPERFPVVVTGRGGRHTYHGPGQRVVYPMLDLSRRGQDVRAYVFALESWVIAALAEFGVRAFTSPAGTGIWVDSPAGEAKIGAIGVRVRRWISFHGVSVNVDCDLSHFDAIIPCGIKGRAVARLCDLVPGIRMSDFDAALERNIACLPPLEAPRRRP
jgi:lipoyl(octanoyl) transferase